MKWSNRFHASGARNKKAMKPTKYAVATWKGNTNQRKETKLNGVINSKGEISNL